MTTDPVLTAVCDTGPLIHLAELDCLDALTDFREILVSPTVREEVEHHRPGALAAPSLSGLIVTPARPAISDALAALCRSFALARGEIEALGFMEANPKALFLTDDAAARIVAAQKGYRVHGTIGLLLRSVRKNRRSARDVLLLLEGIPTRSTLHIRPSLLEEILSTAKREFGLS